MIIDNMLLGASFFSTFGMIMKAVIEFASARCNVAKAIKYFITDKFF